MSTPTFQAAIRTFFGSSEKHNTLCFSKDQDGNINVSIQEVGADMGDMKSGDVRIEAPRGDPSHAELHELFQKVIECIHNGHRKDKKNPTFVVVE